MAETQIHTHTKRRHDDDADPDVEDHASKRSKSDDTEENEHHHKHHHKHHHDEQQHHHKHKHHKHHKHEHAHDSETSLSGADSLALASAELHSQSPISDKKSLVDTDTKSLTETATDANKPTLYELLTTNTVKQLLQEKPKKPVVTIEHNAMLRTCIDRMAENQVLSLPMISAFSVEDAEEGDAGDESGKFMGNLDISTIMHAFIQHMDENGSDPFHVRQFWDRLVITVHSNDADIAGLMKTEENCTLRELIHTCFFTKNVNSIPLTTPPVTVPSELRNDTNALPHPEDAVPVGYVHRVAVFDGKGEVRDIISQTDLIRYLSSHLSSHGSPLLSKTIEELGFAQREVYTISNECTAMQALRIVDEQEWTGVAIVDKKGHLVGSLTTNDLRGMTMSDMDHVLEPICDWLKRVASHLHRESLPVQYVIPAHPISECIEGMLLDSIHRLYVVRSYHDPTPIGVITLTDLLELLFTHY